MSDSGGQEKFSEFRSENVEERQDSTLVTDSSHSELPQLIPSVSASECSSSVPSVLASSELVSESVSNIIRSADYSPFSDKNSSENTTDQTDNEFNVDEKSLEICDCLIPSCPGCHFPCYRCKRTTCGHQCKLRRNWNYIEVECQGQDVVRTASVDLNPICISIL